MPVPTSISSNLTGLSFAAESSLNTLPGSPVWYALEPNSYKDFGATFKLVAREIINATRQRLKGVITDEDAKGGFSVDLTQHNLTRLLQGFFFANAIEKPDTAPLNGTQVPITSVSTTQFLAASGLAGFLPGSLFFTTGFINAANNGLMHATASSATTITAAPVSGTMTAEASPPAGAQLQVCGQRGASGDLVLSVVGASIFLASTALDFTTLGLNVGEWIFIGGDATVNQFATGGNGYARIAVIAAHLLTFDLTSFAPSNDSGTGKLIDLYFGKVLQNATVAANIVRTTYQLERTLGNDGTGTQVEYVTGACPDTLTINIPEANKVTCDLDFVGLQLGDNTGATGVKSGTRVGVLGEAAINTANGVYLSRIAVVNPATLNPTALYAYCSAIKLEIKNGVKPNKAIGVLGGFDLSVGDFAVSGTVTAYFATVAAVAAISTGSSVCLQTILAANNAGMVMDIPLLTLGGGLNKVEKDKPIMVDLTQDAAKCPAGYTMLMCFFQYLPTLAM